MTIQPGQTYRAADPRDLIRIRIKTYTPGENRALVVDAATGKRPRPMLVNALHASPTTQAGKPRRSGYVLEQPATVRDTAHQATGQQPSACACSHPKDRHNTACSHCPCVGYAATWPRQATGQEAAQPDPTTASDPTPLRDQYARAIRDAVRLRLGTNALRLAKEGRPVMLNYSEAEAAADAVLGVQAAVIDTASDTAQHLADLRVRALDRAHALAEQWQGDQTPITRAHAAELLMEVVQLHGWTRTTVEPERHLAPVADGAARQATGQTDTTPEAAVVAYRSIYAPGLLFCRAHNQGWPGFTPLTSDDLPDGGICTWGPNDGPKCGRDVLIDEPRPAPVVGQPAEAQGADRAATNVDGPKR